MKTNKKTIISMAALLLVTLVTAVAIFSANVYSKYLKDKEYEQNQINAEGFYFTVDLLGNTHDAASLTEEIELHGGSRQDIPFHVRNYFDSIRITPTATQYALTLQTELNGVQLKKGETALLTSDGTQTQYTTEQQSIAGAAQTEDAYTLVVPELENEDLRDKNNEITITVSSTIPYAKEMKLVFTVQMYEHDVEYYVLDSVGSPYAELVILANVDVLAGAVTVDWSELNVEGHVFQVDTTNDYVLDVDLTLTTNNPDADADPNDFLSKIRLTQGMESMESISIYFFKSDWSKNYEITRENKIGATEIVGEGNSTYTIELTAATTTP